MGEAKITLDNNPSVAVSLTEGKDELLLLQL